MLENKFARSIQTGNFKDVIFTDVDECLASTICPSYTHCINTEGNYTCRRCDEITCTSIVVFIFFFLFIPIFIKNIQQQMTYAD